MLLKVLTLANLKQTPSLLALSVQLWPLAPAFTVKVPLPRAVRKAALTPEIQARMARKKARRYSR